MERTNYSGIRFKAIALSSVLVLLAVMFTALTVWHGVGDQLVVEEKEELHRASIVAGVRLTALLDALQEDTLILAGSPAITSYLRAPGAEADDDGAETARVHRELVAGFLAEALRVKPAYSAIRIIGVDGQAMERVRVQRTGGSIEAAPADTLRSMAGRSYYREATALRAGQVGLSDLNLDRDRDRDQGRTGTWPPVIRASTPLYDSTGRLVGVLMLTADLTEVLATMQAETEFDAQFFLVNGRGDFLVHPDRRKAFAFEFGRPFRLSDDFPEFGAAYLADPLIPGSAMLDDVAGTKYVLGVQDLVTKSSGQQRVFRLIHATPYEKLITAAIGSWPLILAGGAIAAAVALPLAFLFAGAVVNPLRRMCRTIAAYTPGLPLDNLPVGRRDEIGILARTFDRVIREAEAHRALLAKEVSEHQRIAGTLEHSEALSRNMIDSMLDAHVVSDSHGLICSWNRAAETIFGYSASEVLGKNISLLMPESYSSKHAGYIERYRQGGRTSMMGGRREFPGRRRNGETFPLEITVNTFRTGEGEWYGAVIRDLTGQKAREAELRQVVVALEHAADSIHILDPAGLIVFVNRAWERCYGQRLADVVGKRPSSRHMMDLKGEALRDMIATTQRGEAWSGALRSKTPDGGFREDEVAISPIHDAAGQLTSYVVIGRDVTEKRVLESQLRQAQKLESIGQLAAGIAHEINTPTQYVGDNIRFVQEAFTELNALLGKLTALSGGADRAGTLAQALAQCLGSADLEFLREEVPKALEQSADGCQRISGIVKAMKDFSHPGQDKTPVDLNRAIASTVTVASNEWKYVAEMRTDFDAALPPVVCLPGEFNQVILNILVNAAHAITDVVGDGGRGKGTITVTTRQVGEWAEIRISDTGTGIPPEVREKIFDPFFTTKQVGKGTGQGLAIAHDVIVNKHGGSIALESEPGKGSTFIIRLPLHETRSDAAIAA